MIVKLRHALVMFAVLIFATLFLKENINSMAIIGFSVLLLAYTLFSKDFRLGNGKKALRDGLPLIVYFILALLGFLINKESNDKYLLRLLPFLISPLFIYYFSRFPKSKKKVLTGFVVATLLFLLFLDILAIRDMIDLKSLYVIQDGREYYRFIYTRFTRDYFNHIYLSTFILMSGFLVLQFKPLRSLYARWAIILYLLFHLLILSSRAVIISLVLASLIFLLFYCLQNKRKFKYLILFVLGFIVSSLVVYNFKDTLLLNRYSQIFEFYDNEDRILQRNYSINNRIKVYLIGASLFKDPSYYDLNGTGLSYKTIREQYDSAFKSDFPFETNTFNTHNQYINNFIDWGIIGLLLTVYLLYKPIRASLKSKEYWLLIFWSSFAFILLMESFLIRHRGIIFFVLFYSLFLTDKQPLPDKSKE